MHMYDVDSKRSFEVKLYVEYSVQSLFAVDVVACSLFTLIGFTVITVYNFILVLTYLGIHFSQF